MTKAEYKELVTPAFVRQLFSDSILEPNEERWVITVCGRLVSIGGKVFYGTREQAVKAFYNTFHWRARRDLWQVHHPENPWGWWSEGTDRGAMWNAIKEKLKDEYGLNFIQV